MLNSFTHRKNRLTAFFNIGNHKKNDATPKEIPDGVLKTCPSCNAQATLLEFSQNLYVCPNCNYHIRIGAIERIRQLFDEDSFKELFANIETPVPNKSNDPLDYASKLKKAKSTTKLKEAVVCGVGNINKQKAVAAVMDSKFLMGSMGTAVGDKITKTIEYATKKSLPLIIATTSGGARMQEGIMSLMQMAKTAAALKRHSDKGLLYITLLTHPTTGGVSASFGMLGDIIIAEPDTLIGFAGKRVIERTVQETLPDEFQYSEFVMKKGFIDMIVERKDLKNTISQLLKMHEDTRGINLWI